MLGNIVGKVESCSSEILRAASDMIKIPSRNPPGEESKCALYIYSRLKELGYEAYLVNEPFTDRPQVLGLLRSRKKDAVLLNGHIDTVPEGDPKSWSMDPFSGVTKDGFLYGRGAADMKSSLAIMMYVSKFVETDVSILLAFSVGEERAEPGTSTLLSRIKKFDLNVKYGLVMEPTRLQVATKQRGAIWFKIGIKGRAGHASMPSEGVNAIEISHTVMVRIQEYQNEIAKKLGKFGDIPTFSVTMISGGIKENVIPDECELIIDRRLIPGESSIEATKELSSLLDKTLPDYQLERLGSREAVGISDNTKLARTLLDVTSQMGIPSNIICFGGATDNEHLVANGIESLVWGPGDLKFAHAMDERISITDMKNAAVALGLALNRLPD